MALRPSGWWSRSGLAARCRAHRGVCASDLQFWIVTRQFFYRVIHDRPPPSAAHAASVGGRPPPSAPGHSRPQVARSNEIKDKTKHKIAH